MPKPRLATTSLAGCFGCHMSLLDIDERLLELVELVELDRSPLDDIKEITTHCRIGLIEGGCCNEENVEVLLDYRRHCDLIVLAGDCAINGCIPSMRNTMPLAECLEEAYRRGPTVYNPTGAVPSDPELPLLLDRVYPCSEVIDVDCAVPGCPPPAAALWHAITALLSGRPVELPYEVLKYD